MESYTARIQCVHLKIWERRRTSTAAQGLKAKYYDEKWTIQGWGVVIYNGKCRLVRHFSFYSFVLLTPPGKIENCRL